MKPIIWTEQFSVGHKLLDAQHRQIINTINTLISASGTTVDSELVSQALTDMTLYSRTHFATEERFLLEANYPNFDEHKRYHTAFIRKTVELCNATSIGVTSVPETMLIYLRNWWVEHILKKDMECAFFIAAADQNRHHQLRSKQQ